MPLFLAAAAIGIATSTAGAFQQGRAQKSAEKLRSSNAKVDAARERTRQVRAGRAARAQILQAGANQGASESSSVQAGASGAMAGAFQNIVEINSQESAGRGQSAIRQDIINAQGVQTLGQGITSLAGTAFDNRDELSDIFGIKPTG